MQPKKRSTQKTCAMNRLQHEATRKKEKKKAHTQKKSNV